MSGVECFGAIAAAIGLLTPVIKAFGTRRNAPRQVERLRRMLEDFQDEELLAAAKPKEQRRIHAMINKCTDLLEHHSPRGQSNRPWSFFWPVAVEEQLKLHNDEISEELSRLQGRVHRYSRRVLS